MIINNILKTRINIDKVILIIYINIIWDYITFSQKFKKTKYKKENIYSMIFIDKIEMRELKKLNLRY